MAAPAGILEQATLYLILTISAESKNRARGDLWAATRGALQSGVDLLQLRLKGMTSDEMVPLARRYLSLCLKYQVPLIVNDFPKVCQAVGADGVHLGEHDPDLAAVRAELGEAVLLGATCRNLADLERAEAAGASYVGVGPCFASPTKPELAPLGPESLAPLFRQARIPAFAIGGVSADNLARVVAAGASRVAVSSAVLAARNPSAAAFELKSRLTGC